MSCWKQIRNRRKFLDDIAINLNIENSSDWGKVTAKQFYKFGGGGLLRHYYNGSVFDCLQSVYEEIDWKREWFFQLPRSYWQSTENSRKFLDEVAIKLNIKNPSDWGKVTNKVMHEYGGAGLLKHFNNSLFDCLKFVYEEVHWKRDWFPQFPRSYWKSEENRRKFLDGVAIKLHIQNPSDWGKVTQLLFFELGGRGLLDYYRGSVFKCLQSVYKGNSNQLFRTIETKWKREWFSNRPRLSKEYWNSLENCRKFMNEIANSSNIVSASDWRKVSLALIRNSGGYVNDSKAFLTR